MKITLYRPLALILAISVAATSLAAASDGEIEIVGLWHFDENMDDATGSWSGFGRGSRGKIDREEFKVGSGAYSAVHGEESASNWRHHATGRILLTNHAEIDGAEAFGIALWIRPVKSWAREGRVFSFGRNAFGLAAVPGEEGRFRLADPGFAAADSLSPLDLPLDEWSHLAVAADGGTVRVLVNGELVNEVPQTGPLKGGSVLYLGALDSGGVGLFGTWIDELVLARGPVDAAWVKGVYEQTRTGEPLPYEPPAPPEFVAVERDPGKFLRLSHDRLELTASQTKRLSITATETPLFGGYIPSRMMSNEEEVREIIRDLEAHNCNTIMVSLEWCIARASLLRLFHEHDFRVFVVLPPPYGADFVRQVPDAAQRDGEGNSLRTASFYDPRFIEHLRENFLAEGLEGRGIDALILDEPSHRDYRIALREGRLYHAHPAEQEAYRQMHGRPLGELNLNTHPPDRADYDRLMEFRRKMMHDWLDLVEELVALRAPGVDYHVVLTPDNVTNYRYAGYLRGREATGVDVETLLQSERLRGIQFTAYMNAWGDKDPEWVAGFLPLFKTRAHEQGKASIFWAQAYTESPTQVSRGFHPGGIGGLVDVTVGEGVDGVFLWSYRGFSREGYGWPEFFKEFAETAGQYRDRPAEGLTFALDPTEATISLDVSPKGNGRYDLAVRSAQPGEFTLRVRNRAGIEQVIPVVVRR